MTPLPPLPFVDGSSFYGEPCQALLFDNSALVDWQTCKRLWELKDLRRYASTDEAAGRNFGSAIHRALETRYKLIGPGPVTPECEAAMNDALARYFSESPAPAMDFRGLSHAQKFLAVYNTVYPHEPFRILTTTKGEPFVERTFALPFGEVNGQCPKCKGRGLESRTVDADYPCPMCHGKKYAPIRIVYTGKIDLAIEQGGDQWTKDHKTTFQFGRTIDMDWAVDGGQTGYVWAFSQTMGRRPRGFLINAMRVRKPSKADAYGDSAPIDSSDFKRLPFDVSQEDLDDWREDTLALVEEILWCHARGYFSRSRKACVGKYGPCDFYNVCSVQRSARQQILESNLYEENVWTPLNKPN